jgi:hypothetical protein
VQHEKHKTDNTTARHIHTVQQLSADLAAQQAEREREQGARILEQQAAKGAASLRMQRLGEQCQHISHDIGGIMQEILLLFQSLMLAASTRAVAACTVAWRRRRRHGLHMHLLRWRAAALREACRCECDLTCLRAGGLAVPR